MTIAERVRAVKGRIGQAARECGRNPAAIALVAAAKSQSTSRVREAIAAGVDACGENRAQEFLKKRGENAYEGAEVHFIGRQQKNKVKYIVGAVDLIESVDSEELLLLIHRRAMELGTIQRVLIEVNIGGELSKGGISPKAVGRFLETASKLSGISVRGLMAIPPADLASGSHRSHFAEMYKLFVDIRANTYDNISVAELSMGMSGDFEDAVREGATIVRVGTAIFGARQTGFGQGLEEPDGSPG